MSDWTTARVVRDCYGDLWGSEDDNPGAWTRLGCDWMNAEPERELERDCGPLTPILDADGLPVVRTVGDLTARHIGKRVRVEGREGSLAEVTHYGDVTALVLCDEEGDPAWFPACGPDTPCEVLA